MELQATVVYEKNWNAINALLLDNNGDVVLDELTGTPKRRYRYIIDEGSSRSSKTFSLIDCCDLYARSIANKRITIWRDTKVDCKATVGNDMERHLKNTNRWRNGFAYNVTESKYKYHDGSTIELNGIAEDLKAHGLSQDVAWLNEPYKISREIFDQIDQRTSDFMFLDWNPKKAHFIEELKKDPRTLVIHSTFKDNPKCPPEQRTKILSYQPVAFCDAVTLKLLRLDEAKIYDIIKNPVKLSDRQLKELIRCKENEHKSSANEYNWSVYGLGVKAERPNRIFKWTEISDDAYNKINAEIYTGCDWGAVDPWGIVDAKYYDGGLYLRERNYLSENLWREKLTPTEWAQVNGSDEGIVSWLFGRLGIPFDRTIVCDTNRTAKILALREAGWEYAIAADKPKGSVLDGVDGLNNLKVYYTSSSENLKYEQENYSRQVDRYGVVLEEPEDIDNHIIDPTRYIWMFLMLAGIIRKV